MTRVCSLVFWVEVCSLSLGRAYFFYAPNLNYSTTLFFDNPFMLTPQSILESAEGQIVRSVLRRSNRGAEYTGMQTDFVQTVAAILDIQTRKLYKAKYSNIKDYFLNVFSVSRAQIYRLIECAEIVAVLKAVPFAILPHSQAVCNHLKPILAKGEDALIALWLSVVRLAKGAEILPCMVATIIAKRPQKSQHTAEDHEYLDKQPEPISKENHECNPYQNKIKSNTASDQMYQLEQNTSIKKHRLVSNTSDKNHHHAVQKSMMNRKYHSDQSTNGQKYQSNQNRIMSSKMKYSDHNMIHGQDYIDYHSDPKSDFLGASTLLLVSKFATRSTLATGETVSDSDSLFYSSSPGDLLRPFKRQRGYPSKISAPPIAPVEALEPLVSHSSLPTYLHSDADMVSSPYIGRHATPTSSLKYSTMPGIGSSPCIDYALIYNSGKAGGERKYSMNNEMFPFNHGVDSPGVVLGCHQSTALQPALGVIADCGCMEATLDISSEEMAAGLLEMMATSDVKTV